MNTEKLAEPHARGYEAFVAEEGGRLRQVLVARYGVEVGSEVTADALVWAWEHWGEISDVHNPVGYLFRVAQSSARRYWRWRRRPKFPPEVPEESMAPEPGLPGALAALRESHRTAVLLVHAHAWTYREAADVLGVPESTVRNHVHRGMRKLRRLMGAHDEH